MSVDLPAKVLEIVSTVNVGNSEKGMEDDVHFNKETNAGILKKITVEECSSRLHLSEGLESLIEPTQRFQEEHYSSVGIAVNETETEVFDIGLVIGSTSVETSEDGFAGEDNSSVTLHEISSVHLGDQPVDPIKELKIPLSTGSPAEDNIEVLVGSILASYSEALEGGGDILPSVDPSAEDTVSTMNVEEIDEGYSNDEAIVGILSETVCVEDPEEYYPKVYLSEELESNTEHEYTFEEHHYSSNVVIETEVEAGYINNDFKMTETDPSLETHNNLIEDYTLEKLSQSKTESQSSKTLDYASTRQFEDLKVDKSVVPLENVTLVEDIDLVLRFTSAVQGEGDLLSDINSVKMNSHPTEVIRAVSTCEENILDLSKAREIHHESAVQADILSDTVPDEQEKIHNNVSEEIVSSLQPIQKLEENQHNSSSQVSSEESCIGFDIISTSEGNGKVLLEDQEDKEMDPSAETHCSLITDHTVEMISESKEEEESQPSEMLDDASRREFGDLKVNEPVIPLEMEYHVEDIDVIFGSTSKLSQGEDDLSAKMTDHRTEVISLVTTTVEEDISDTIKVCEVIDESAVRVDILPDTAISDDQEKITNNVLAISSSEELGSSLEPSQKLGEYEHSPSFPVSKEESLTGSDIVNSAEENVPVLLEDQKHKDMDLLYEVQSGMTLDYLVGFTTSTSTVKVIASDEAAESEKEGSEETTQEFACSKLSEEPEKKLNEQDFSTVSTTGTHPTEDITGFENNKSLETTDYFGSSGLEIQLLPSMDHTKQTGMEGEGKEKISNEEALCLGQNKPVITIRTEDLRQLTEPPTYIEMSEDQERSVVDQKGTLTEPSVEEEDDIDNNLLPHNTLDISAQKSRVQLRRKTSIRRKQGQRQVTPDSELVEPPQPVSRPRPMGVAIFPGDLPVFPATSAMTSVASHSPEEPKEAKPAEEEFLIKPKKGIPKHAGFGIPHPQMMQELQTRLKKKKPNK
ncbi:apolipoprotein B receptor [Bufo bufo]|uniref:apolipoprotein B receptor n=1 Tax=Bufo bufo TaxID=8384 RepID=UPI001ABE1DB0|nr:apolipoprotein B receptor [Bufo bufo]